MIDLPETVLAALDALRFRRKAAKHGGEANDREPSLSDLLDDPLTRQVMASDRIDLQDLSQLMNRIRGQLATRGQAAEVDMPNGRPRRL